MMSFNRIKNLINEKAKASKEYVGSFLHRNSSSSSVLAAKHELTFMQKIIGMSIPVFYYMSNVMAARDNLYISDLNAHTEMELSYDTEDFPTMRREILKIANTLIHDDPNGVSYNKVSSPYCQQIINGNVVKGPETQLFIEQGREIAPLFKSALNEAMKTLCDSYYDSHAPTSSGLTPWQIAAICLGALGLIGCCVCIYKNRPSNQVYNDSYVPLPAPPAYTSSAQSYTAVVINDNNDTGCLPAYHHHHHHQRSNNNTTSVGWSGSSSSTAPSAPEKNHHSTSSVGWTSGFWGSNDSSSHHDTSGSSHSHHDTTDHSSSHHTASVGWS